MRKLRAILTLIRLPNLVFIFLTQILSWYFLILPVIGEGSLSVSFIYLLSFSTIFIAAAGYMINDYFDMGIDAINKPGRVTIEKIFKRRSVIIWHILLNVTALLMAGYIAYRMQHLRLLILQFISIFLLIIYSLKFKRKLVAGNLMISTLTSMTLLTLAFYEREFPMTNFIQSGVKFFWMYVAFAFLITFSREVVKDIEDIKGDDAQACKTIPLVWGIRIAKQIVYGILMVLIGLLLFMCIHYYETHKILVIYWAILLIVPLGITIFQLYLATNSVHFNKVSSMIKLITLAGILSMIFIEGYE